MEFSDAREIHRAAQVRLAISTVEAFARVHTNTRMHTDMEIHAYSRLHIVVSPQSFSIPRCKLHQGERSSEHRRNLSCAATDVIAFRSSNRMILVFSGIRAVQFKRYSVRGNRSEDADQGAEFQSKFSFHILITHTSYRYNSYPVEIS